MIASGEELAQAALEVAGNHKTIYVMGCFGAPMTENNKKRYITAQSYNNRTDRRTAIMGTSSDTFGFDCVGLIKGILWGWKGEKDRVYGGAEYQSAEVPDLNANQMLRVCKEVSDDFTTLCLGEVLWMQDHIGVYIGNGLAAECTPRWADGCQITAVYNLGKKPGYSGRTWKKHGKLPYITYEAGETSAEDTYELSRFIREVQRMTGSYADGIAGRETIRNTVTLSRRKNAAHKVVVPVQRRLQALGFYQDKIDGHFGKNTEQAVLNYQKDIGNRFPDGEITAGKRTWRYLLGME